MWSYFFHSDFFGCKYDLKLDGRFISSSSSSIISIIIIILPVFFWDIIFIKSANPSIKGQTELKLLKFNIGVWISLPWLTFIGFNIRSKTKASLAGWLNLYITI